MLLGYVLILCAACFWGMSGVFAKYLSTHGLADALLLSQARVTFAWAFLFLGLAVRAPRRLRLGIGDLWRFSLLGVVGVACSNYFLYAAFERMDTALADLIQFIAPVVVALWMWFRGFEPLERSKLFSLGLCITGTALALGVFQSTHKVSHISWQGVSFAATSTFAYSFIIVWGKHLSGRYSTSTYLHYSLLTAAIFWLFVVPPGRFLASLATPHVLEILVLFAVVSVLIPYSCMFAGLRLVPASRAAIVSTLEPVVILIGAWALLGEVMTLIQTVGIAMVLIAIAVVETAPAGKSEAKTQVDEAKQSQEAVKVAGRMKDEG